MRKARSHPTIRYFINKWNDLLCLKHLSLFTIERKCKLSSISIIDKKNILANLVRDQYCKHIASIYYSEGNQSVINNTFHSITSAPVSFFITSFTANLHLFSLSLYIKKAIFFYSNIVEIYQYVSLKKVITICSADMKHYFPKDYRSLREYLMCD